MEFEVKENQTYLTQTDKKGATVGRVVLNASIEIIGYDALRSRALVEIVTVEGVESRVMDFNVFTGRSQWIKWLNPLSWFGTQGNLELYKQFLMDTRQKNSMIILNEFSGRYVEEGIDVLVAADGVYVKNDGFYLYQNGSIIFHAGGKMVYASPCKDHGRQLFGMYKPSKENLESPEDVFFKTWFSLFGDKVLMNALLGWMLAVFFMPEVLMCRKQRFFPFFFLHGNTEVGKTALLESAIKLFGVIQGANYGEVTPFVEYKHLSSTSLIPIWRDEYRDRGNNNLAKEGLARSLYSLTQVEKGTADQQLLAYKPLTTWLLSGEGSPRDQAYLRRCIRFTMNKKARVTSLIHQESADMADTLFPSMLKYLWLKGFDKKAFNQVYNLQLETPNGEKEEKICYAALGALFGVKVGTVALQEANAYWKEKINDGKFDTDDTVNQFWTDVYHQAVQNGWLQAPANGEPKLFSYIDVIENEVRIRHRPLIEAITERMNWQNKSSHGRNIKNLIIEKYGAGIQTVNLHGCSAHALVIDKWKILEDDSLIDLVAAHAKAVESQEEKERRDAAW